MILIVGLGNPGPEYEGTRHNAGFMVMDRLADTLRATFTKENKYAALVARPEKKDTILAKPLTYMNLSGRSVHKLATFHKIKPENVWVVYDDVDLPVGAGQPHRIE